MRLNALCEESSHWETDPNGTILVLGIGEIGALRVFEAMCQSDSLMRPRRLEMLHRDCWQSSSPVQNPVLPCVFVLTKGMSAVGPRPTADIHLPLLARHPHRCSDRLGMSGRARMSLASIQPFGLLSGVSASWGISCGGVGGISRRGAPLPIGVIRHLLD